MGTLEDLMAKQRDLEESLKANGASQQPTAVIDKSLVEQVQDNLARAEELRSETSVELASVQSENHRLQYDVYGPKIRALEDERDQLMRENTSAQEKKQDLKQKEIDDLYVVVNQVKRILNFLRVDDTKVLAVDDDDVKPHRDKQKVGLGYIFDDDYLKIKLFIVENDKPKNKFSLIAVGRCLFGEHLLKLPRSYGIRANTGFGNNIEVAIRDAPSVDELGKLVPGFHAGKGLSDLKGDYEKVKEEYLAILDRYRAEDFLELMTDHCTCGNFLTIFDSYALRDGVLPCGRCSKNMTKEKDGNSKSQAM